MAWKGLIGSKPQAILFQTRFGIHTIGVSYPIDVVILDKNSIIQKIKINVLPNSLFFWNPLFDTVLELPSGTVKSKKLLVKQQLQLEYL